MEESALDMWHDHFTRQPRSYTMQTPNNSIRRTHVHIKLAILHANLPTLDSTPLSSREPHHPSRTSPIASPTEENNTQSHSQSPVQILLQLPAMETITPNEPESPATHANTSDNTENSASKAKQVRTLRPAPESATSDNPTENTRMRTQIIKPPLRFRDYELT